jgi:hypothetical protein
MSTISTIGVLGLDSALCCLAFGTAVRAPGTRLGVALLFGLCDLIASLLASLPMTFIVPMPAAPLYTLCAMSLGLGVRFHPRLVWAAPFVLSLDNLTSASSVTEAFADGASSALFALVALQLGAWWVRSLVEPLGTGSPSSALR